jgi:hypothetical protein
MMTNVAWVEKALRHIARTQDLVVVASADPDEPHLAVLAGRTDSYFCWDLRDADGEQHFTLWLLDDGAHLLRHPKGAPVVGQLLSKHLDPMPVHSEVDFPVL